LPVALEGGFGQIAEGGAGGLLAAAFPGGTGAGLLLRTGLLKAFLVEFDSCVASRIDHEVERQAEGLI